MINFAQKKDKTTTVYEAPQEKMDMRCSSCGVIFRAYGVAEGDPCRNPDKAVCRGKMVKIDAQMADSIKRRSDGAA